MVLEVQTHNDGGNINVDGTCLQGYLNNTQGQQLVEKFGEPLLGRPKDKVEFEWNLLIEGKPVTIYSWKNYGEKSFEQIRVWNVGGKNKQVLDLLRQVGLRPSESPSFW
jgi:hypothetical protein